MKSFFPHCILHQSGTRDGEGSKKLKDIVSDIIQNFTQCMSILNFKIIGLFNQEMEYEPNIK